MSTSAICPDCDFEIRFESPPVRKTRVTCPRCQTVLRVVKSDPLKLDWDFVEPLEGTRRTSKQSSHPKA